MGVGFLKEQVRDLFDVDNSYAVAHCVSQDFKMGAGIAKQFRNRYPKMAEHCLSKNPKIGDAVMYEHGGKIIFNLVTKKYYHNKPTYTSLEKTLVDMKKQMNQMGLQKIAMPLIGCGLDRLNWQKVKDIILSTFHDAGIEIIVCRIEGV